MVLFVDDDHEVVDLMAHIFDRLGYSMIAVDDPRSALALFSSSPEKFDAVIVDEMMPVMRGTQLARQLLRIKDDIPVVLLTGYGAVISEEEARSSGIRVMLTKPIEVGQLKAVLEKLSVRRSQKR